MKPSETIYLERMRQIRLLCLRTHPTCRFVVMYKNDWIEFCTTEAEARAFIAESGEKGDTLLDYWIWII